MLKITSKSFYTIGARKKPMVMITVYDTKMKTSTTRHMEYSEYVVFKSTAAQDHAVVPSKVIVSGTYQRHGRAVVLDDGA